MRSLKLTLLAWTTLSAAVAPQVDGQAGRAAPESQVRAELQRRYDENNAAFLRRDVGAIMALRAPDFHTVGPDGTTRDRAAMERYTQGFLNGIQEWNSITITIDSLSVAGDTASAIVSQHLSRMALRPDNQVHQVETWATQREIWVRHEAHWLLWRVDQVRNQRRMVDGQPDPVWRPSWPGTSIAVLSGNLSGSGPFVFRFRMPDGYWICPHTHPVNAHIKTVSGTFLVGMGKTFDTAVVRALEPGQDVRVEAQMAHYEGARGDTDIEVRGTGPWSITFLDSTASPARGGGGTCR